MRAGAELRSLLSTAAPLFYFEMGLSTCYAIVASLSAQFSVASTAAFQALWNPTSVLGFATYPLKQAAQVFLPPMLAGPDQTVGGAPKSREFLKVLASLASVCGVVLSTSVLALASRPSLFTPDAGIHPLITSFGPLAAAGLLAVGFAQVLEGVLLGTGDLAFLSWSQLGNVLASVSTFALARVAGLGVHGAWLVFIALVISRLVQGAVRVFVQRRPWDAAVAPIR